MLGANGCRVSFLDPTYGLPDHLQLLWSLPEADADYAKRVRLMKDAFTRAYRYRRAPPVPNASRTAKREQAIWQRRYWGHTIRDEEDFLAHLDYIHLNPVHHGVARAPADWPCSSFASWVAREVYGAQWGEGVTAELPAWVRKWE